VLTIYWVGSMVNRPATDRARGAHELLRNSNRWCKEVHRSDSSSISAEFLTSILLESERP
jgi:hypothetical protein